MTGTLINQILDEVGLEPLDTACSDDSDRRYAEKEFEYPVRESVLDSVWRHNQRNLPRYFQNIME